MKIKGWNSFSVTNPLEAKGKLAYNQLGQLWRKTQRSGTNASGGYLACSGPPGGLGDRLLARLDRVPHETRGGIVGVFLVGFALVAAPRRFKRQVALSLRSAVQACFLDDPAVQASVNRKLKLPSLFWRAVTVVTVICLIGCDPAFERLWTAQAQFIPPAQEDPSATRVTEYSYDLQGRLTQERSPEGTINYAYDPATGRHNRISGVAVDVTHFFDVVILT
ncbi:MAG TPA: RHS repeat domain-containing protein [Clostridia bacterium]|nr:RHS repeat domain-containing protein [Clostridia bacterium]